MLCGICRAGTLDGRYKQENHESMDSLARPDSRSGRIRDDLLYLKLYYDTGGAGTVGHTFHALGILWGFTSGYQMNNTNFLR